MITIVTGPPCAGKTTYVRDNAADDDIVIDLDRIAQAMTAEGATMHDQSEHIRRVARDARMAAIKSAMRLAQGERYLGVWIVHTNPTIDDRRAYRALGAHIVEVNPGREKCLERLAERPLMNQVLSRPVIEAYYASH